MRFSFLIVVVTLFVAAHVCATNAQEIGQVRVDTIAHGSLPPVPQLYRCIGNQSRKAYNPKVTKDCLDSILSSGFFQDGKTIVTSGHPDIFVTYYLTSSSLTVKNIDFDILGSLKEPLVEWLDRGEETLHVGDEYDGQRDQRLRELIVDYFFDTGRAVGITRIVDLDYKERTATVKYKILGGPDITRRRMAPPYEPDCTVTSVNQLDVDDRVPDNLLDHLTRVHAFDCYDAAAVSQDTAALVNSDLFSAVRYTEDAEPGQVTINQTVHAKPIRVSEVRISGYGLFSDLEMPIDIDLPLKAGNAYSRTLADQSKDLLAQKYATSDDKNVSVYEEDRLTMGNELVVTFQVFGFDQDAVTVNGKTFKVPFTSGLSFHAPYNDSN